MNVCRPSDINLIDELLGNLIYLALLHRRQYKLQLH